MKNVKNYKNFWKKFIKKIQTKTVLVSVLIITFSLGLIIIVLDKNQENVFQKKQFKDIIFNLKKENKSVEQKMFWKSIIVFTIIMAIILIIFGIFFSFLSEKINVQKKENELLNDSCNAWRTLFLKGLKTIDLNYYLYYKKEMTNLTLELKKQKINLKMQQKIINKSDRINITIDKNGKIRTKNNYKYKYLEIKKQLEEEKDKNEKYLKKINDKKRKINLLCERLELRRELQKRGELEEQHDNHYDINSKEAELEDILKCHKYFKDFDKRVKLLKRRYTYDYSINSHTRVYDNIFLE